MPVWFVACIFTRAHDPMATFPWQELLPVWQGSSRREELVAWQPYALAGQAAEEELNLLRACTKSMQLSLPR